MKTSLALIGFMGTGKSGVGKALAAKLGKEFIELDALIAQKAGKTIPEIFQQDGEAAFRELEIEVTGKVAGKKNAVIACGGGIVLHNINIDRLKKESLIVYLTASPEVILKRVGAGAHKRPLLNVKDKAATITELLRYRRPFYERVADITVDSSGLDINAVVGQIIGKVRENESIDCQE